MDKLNPHHSEERLEKWKDKDIEGISKQNAQLLRNYILDMERGLNTNGNKKGSRSAIRLNSTISRLKKLMELTEAKFKLKDILQLTEKQAHDLFLDMHSGKIIKSNGEPYKSVGDYIKIFKAFWHWNIKRNKKEGKAVIDITQDLQGERKNKPPFVYFTKEQLDEMLKLADYETKVLMLFLFDTGIRAPTEAFNVRVSDLSNNCKELNIRQETSKTFGRKIKLMLCSEALRSYIFDNHLKDDNYLFPFNNATINKRLKKIGSKYLGDKVTLGREKGSNLTMYDFRHSAVCYWLPRYKSRSALLYRLGWREEKEIYYYSELLGMTDTISEEDMLISIDKTKLEKKVALLEEVINNKTKNYILLAELTRTLAEELGKVKLAQNIGNAIKQFIDDK